MKLKSILKNVDFLQMVKIYDAGAKDDSTALFEGSVFDVPWSIADMKIEEDETVDSIYTQYDREKNEVHLIFYVTD